MLKQEIQLVLTVVNIKITAFYDVMSCSMIERYQHFHTSEDCNRQFILIIIKLLQRIKDCSSYLRNHNVESPKWRLTSS